MEKYKPLNLQPDGGLILWFRNGCTSGLDMEQAKTKFASLSEDEQEELRIEFDNLRQNILKGESGWTAPFAG